MPNGWHNSGGITLVSIPARAPFTVKAFMSCTYKSRLLFQLTAILVLARRHELDCIVSPNTPQHPALSHHICSMGLSYSLFPSQRSYTKPHSATSNAPGATNDTCGNHLDVIAISAQYHTYICIPMNRAGGHESAQSPSDTLEVRNRVKRINKANYHCPRQQGQFKTLFLVYHIIYCDAVSSSCQDISYSTLIL